MNTLTTRKKPARIILLSAMLALSVPMSVLAGGTGAHKHQNVSDPKQENAHGHHQHSLDWGEPGRAAEVNRTIEVTMGDVFFKPESIQASEGDTIRFVLKNVGNLIHEFNIGTDHMHKEHQQEMVEMLKQGVITATSINHNKMEHSGMKHDDANSVLLEPGESAELIWRFTKPKKLEFACNVPGHYEAGMVGLISVETSVSLLR